MANFIRLGAIHTINNNLIKSISTKRPKPSSLSCSLTRCINTSSKPPQANTVNTASTTVTSTTPTVTHNNTDDDKSEDWISWGFNHEDIWWDRFAAHLTFFTGVSLCLCLGGTILAYVPDPMENEWTTREAYLQLRYREENGLPLIDPNLIDPSKFTLPTDEELGDKEIII